MTDAKPVEVGALVARLDGHSGNLAFHLGFHERLHRDSRDALLALQAEVARLVDNARVAEGLQKATARRADMAEAERDRLTQENARLAGEVAALKRAPSGIPINPDMPEQSLKPNSELGYRQFCGECDGTGTVGGGSAILSKCGRCEGSGLEPLGGPPR